MPALALAMMAAPQVVFADIGPKPTISFVFAFDRPGVGITDGALLECEDAKCASPAPLGQLGPQRFICQATSCDGMAYGFSAHAVLEVTLSDGRVLRSGVFPQKDFNAKFKVAVKGSVLEVTRAK